MTTREALAALYLISVEEGFNGRAAGRLDSVAMRALGNPKCLVCGGPAYGVEVIDRDVGLLCGYHWRIHREADAEWGEIGYHALPPDDMPKQPHHVPKSIYVTDRGCPPPLTPAELEAR